MLDWMDWMNLALLLSPIVLLLLLRPVVLWYFRIPRPPKNRSARRLA